MCGVLLAVGGRAAGKAEQIAQVLPLLKHRGPDASAIAEIPGGVIAHTRLSILDLTDAAAQPMRDEVGNLLAYNGEIYSYNEDRRRLVAQYGPRTWRSSGDTEVLLQGLRLEGPDFLRRLDGIFAFAWWDATRRTIWLARDRCGVKPLYYTLKGDTLVVSSEVRALANLCATLGLPLERDLTAVGQFLRLGSVDEPFTIYKDVFSVPAGSALRFALDRDFAVRHVSTMVHRSLDEVLPAPPIRQAVEEAITGQLVSDVPLAVFLSGGVDSTIVASVASGSRQISTFCVSVDNPALDEAARAERTARRIGSHHTTVRLPHAILSDWIIEAILRQDLPSIDGHNTYVVAKAAATSGIRVALSGLGGDELFGGYSIFRRLPLLWRARRYCHIPATIARVLVPRVAPERLLRLLESIAAQNLDDCYIPLRALRSLTSVRALMPAWQPRSRMPPSDSSVYEWVRRAELSYYLRSQLLRDTDVMGMANSVEIRVPFLANAVVDRALLTPAHTLRSNGGKAPLKEALADHLHDGTPFAVKTGFRLDLTDWLAHGGRDFANACLNTLRDSHLLESTRLRTAQATLHKTTRRDTPRLLSLVALGAALDRAQ